MAAVRGAGRWKIIFGGNYYDCPPAKCWLVWDKDNGANDFADCELAWTNLPKAVRRLKWTWNGFIRQGEMSRKPGQWDVRNHPTEKPVELYKWLLSRYCPEGGTVLDPTAGSFNSCFAAQELGRNAIGIEKDTKFYDKAVTRSDTIEHA
jgi:hypothetical protein